MQNRIRIDLACDKTSRENHVEKLHEKVIYITDINAFPWFFYNAVSHKAMSHKEKFMQ